MTNSWYARIQHVLKMSEAARHLCELTVEDYTYYCERRSAQISSLDARKLILEFSGSFGNILDTIQANLKQHTEQNTPSCCALKVVDLTAYKSAWNKHAVGNDRQNLSELNNTLQQLSTVIRSKLRALYDQDTGGYSSYSDYSEETDSTKMKTKIPATTTTTTMKTTTKTTTKTTMIVRNAKETTKRDAGSEKKKVLFKTIRRPQTAAVRA